MANYANLKATIDANIKANGTEAITGPVLNSVLTAAVNTLGAGYQFMGVATTSTSPGTPDANVFYIAATPGTYTNFGGLTVADGEVAILKYNGSWTKEVTGAATAAQLTQLGQKVYDLVDKVYTGYELANEGMAANATRLCSGFMPIDESLHYETDVTFNFIHCFDVNRIHLGYVNIGASLLAGTKFVRIQWRNTDPTPYFYSYNPVSYDTKMLRESVEHNSPNSLFTIGTNLYDHNDPDCLPFRYIGNSGQYASTTPLKISGYIPVTPGLNYYVNNTVAHGYAFYDKDFNLTHNGLQDSQPMVAQAGDAYLRVTLYAAKDGTENIVNSGSALAAYTPYKKSLKAELLPQIPATAIADDAITTPKLSDGAVTPGKTDFIHPSDNLLNKQDTDYQDGKYFYQKSDGTGSIGSSANLSVSGYIPVSPGDTLNAYYAHSYAFFDANKTYITNSYVSPVGYGKLSVSVPSGAAYARVNLYLDKSATLNGELNRINIGSFIYPYVPYGYRLEDSLGVANSDQLEGMVGKNSASIESASLADGSTMTLSRTPQSLCKNNRYAFSGKFSSFGTLIVGKGATTYNARYFKITATEIALFDYIGSETLLETKTHGLTLSGYISIVVTERDGKADVVLQTLSDSYAATFDNYQYYSNGQTRATASGMSLTDCKLSWANPDLKLDTWVFGDSYFGMNSTNREMYWLNEWGALDKVLNQHYAGQGSAPALEDLVRCLDFGCPKRLIWALGMNNDNSSTLADITTGDWYDAIRQVAKICEQRGIEFIPATIPQVRSTSYKNKDLMSAWVRSSGYRYVDVAAAVGSNASGEWYGNGTAYDYQSPDNVHPSEYGAKAIATRFLLDVPELD